MSSYESLALRYDALTADVDHEAWADYLEKHFSRSPIPIHTVLDLACGTGAMTCLLAQRGYEMIGVDLSAEMLSVATEKAQDLTGVIPPCSSSSLWRIWTSTAPSTPASAAWTASTM